MLKTILITIGLFISQAIFFCANAELINKGSGLIYDTDLDVTWLQDANYAHTSDYADADSLGRMQWEDAMKWAENLEYQGYSGWRLPKALLEDGSVCSGLNCDQTEALHLFIEEGISRTASSPFYNLKDNYWTQTEYSGNTAWVITYNSSGVSNIYTKSAYLYAIALHDGELTPKSDNKDQTNNHHDGNSETNGEAGTGNSGIGCFIATIFECFQ
jgi:hypothetical protein